MRMSILKKAAASLFGNAGVGDVLEDKTFQSITAGAAATGTMPNRGQYDITPGKLPVLIPDGYHDGTGIVDSLGGDAEAKHVLETVSFSSDEAGREVAGTMTNRGGVVITPGASNKTIPEGYHDGTGYVEGDANLEAGNIKSGVEIFGVTGTLTPDSPPAGNAAVSDVLEGKTFESAVAGAGAVGSMPNRTGFVTAQSITYSGTTLMFRPQPGHYPGDSGNAVQYSDTNWIAENLKKGVSVFGKIGSLEAKVLTASNNLKTSSDAETAVLNSTYTKLKEIVIGGTGSIKVTWEARSYLGDRVYVRIYKNDVPYNDEQYWSSSSYGAYGLFELPLMDVFKNDKIQLYAMIPPSHGAGFVRNFRIYYDIIDIPTIVPDVVNL